MKAILVVDMPNSCDECPCCYEGYSYCSLLRRELGVWAFHTGKPVDCPLMPVPLKRKSVIEWLPPNENYKIVATHELTEYDKGWNECVEFLEGEEND